MEEVDASYVDHVDIGGYCTDMYRRVEKNNPVMGWINGVRIVMFAEEKNVDPQYDGPR